jgi:hypothetical protein
MFAQKFLLLQAIREEQPGLATLTVYFGVICGFQSAISEFSMALFKVLLIMGFLAAAGFLLEVGKTIQGYKNLTRLLGNTAIKKAIQKIDKQIEKCVAGKQIPQNQLRVFLGEVKDALNDGLTVYQINNSGMLFGNWAVEIIHNIQFCSKTVDDKDEDDKKEVGKTEPFFALVLKEDGEEISRINLMAHA